jgi:DNA-binding winged helix-turn-helix (wHTH) protein
MLTDSDESARELGAYGLSIRRPAFESSARHHSASASAGPEEQVLDGKRFQRRDIFSFGPFRLVATERLLEKDGVPLNLGSRALDLLIALVERATEVVSKRELMARAWPNLVVDEGSLRFHIASLRKVLGDGQSGVRYVANVAGRGYCFVAPISRSAAQSPLAESATLDWSHSLSSEFERVVLRRLAVFVGSFSLEAARSVAAETPVERGQVVEVVASLVAKSLVAECLGARRSRSRHRTTEQN